MSFLGYLWTRGFSRIGDNLDLENNIKKEKNVKIKGKRGDCVVWISAKDTYNWAHRAGASWPCSTLSGKRLCATIQNDDLVDITINGKYGIDADGYEVDAILADFGARGER